MYQLSSKTAVVTGGNRGLGQAIAMALADAGAHIVITHLDSPADRESANTAVNDIKQKGRDALAVPMNVVDKDSVNKAVNQIFKHFEQIDILVNNAGVMQKGVGLESTSEDFDLCANVNVKGIWHVTQAFIPHFQAKQAGKIVNIASIGGRRGEVLMPYDASKAAAISITQSLATLLGKDNINVNAVCPGPVATPLWDDLAKQAGPGLTEFEDHLQSVPLGRVSTPQDIANAVLFFASDQSHNITGQALNVDGGFRMN